MPADLRLPRGLGPLASTCQAASVLHDPHSPMQDNEFRGVGVLGSSCGPSGVRSSTRTTNDSRSRLTLVGQLNDAEAIAVGVFQHDEIIVLTVLPRVAGSPDPDQPLHLGLLVGGVEVQVHPAVLAE